MSDDGVTVDLPLERLMTIDDRAFDWHVPGHRVELVTELIRSLPKRLRREFVPAGQFAPRLVEAMDLSAPDLSEELARQMRLLNGTVVSPDDFDFDALPSHLRVTFRITESGARAGPRQGPRRAPPRAHEPRARGPDQGGAPGGAGRPPHVGRRRHRADDHRRTGHGLSRARRRGHLGGVARARHRGRADRGDGRRGRPDCCRSRCRRRSRSSAGRSTCTPSCCSRPGRTPTPLRSSRSAGWRRSRRWSSATAGRSGTRSTFGAPARHRAGRGVRRDRAGRAHRHRHPAGPRRGRPHPADRGR